MQSDTKDRKLFIGGLNHDTVEATLGEYFQQWGEVIDCVIMKDYMGRSRGFGFVTYKEPYQLQNAQRNGKHIIDSKEVDAKLAVPKDQQEQVDANSEQCRKLFVGGLNYDTTVDGLKSYFSQYGDVVDCHVMRDNEGRSRGFGFVTYNDLSQLEDAQNRRPHTIDGKVVETKRAMPKDVNSGNTNMTVKKMFVGGLKEDTTEAMIREVFSKYGNIEDVDILKDKSNGRPRGFCFVLFSDYDSVDRAVLKKRHDLNGCNVEVRKAVGKDQMPPRGPPPNQRFGGPRDRWMDSPQRSFPNRGGRFDRGGDDGFNDFRGPRHFGNFEGRGGWGGRGGYNDNFGGPSGGNGGGNFRNSGGGGGSNFGNYGGGDGCGGNFGNYGVDGRGGNFRNYGGDGRGGNFGNYGDSRGNFGNSGGGSGNFGNSGVGSANFGNSGGGNDNFGNSRGSGYGNSGVDGYGNFSSGSSGFNNYNNQSGSNNNYNNPSGGNGFGGNSDNNGGAAYQQQNWSGSGGFNNNTGNNWTDNDGSGAFGNNYNSSYGGGPVKASGGFSARSQGPYGGGYGSNIGSTNNRSGGGGGWQ